VYNWQDPVIGVIDQVTQWYQISRPCSDTSTAIHLLRYLEGPIGCTD